MSRYTAIGRQIPVVKLEDDARAAVPIELAALEEWIARRGRRGREAAERLSDGR